jgi:hypothetical protein
MLGVPYTSKIPNKTVIFGVQENKVSKEEPNSTVQIDISNVSSIEFP